VTAPILSPEELLDHLLRRLVELGLTAEVVLRAGVPRTIDLVFAEGAVSLRARDDHWMVYKSVGRHEVVVPAARKLLER